MIDYNLLYDLIEYNKYRHSCFKNGIIPIFEDKNYEKILDARYHKVSRIKKRLVYLVTRFKYIYFVTFTFDDERINLCDRSRKDLIKSSILTFDNDVKYILNIDYGNNTERLHYHCIVATNNSGDLFHHIKKTYPCYTWIDKVYFSDNSVKRISKYINKLSNHACKDSTQKSRVLYNFKGYDVLDKYLAKRLFLIDCMKVGL